MRIPQFIVGITIVSVGTSLPEFVSCLFGVLKDSPEIVLANVIGSNIANILLIVGIGAVMVKKIVIDRDLIDLDAPLLLLATAGLVVMILWDKTVNFWEGIIALSFYLIYLWYFLKQRTDHERSKKTESPKKLPKLVLGVVISGLFIFLGGNYLIESVLKISELLNIGTSIMALSVVAIGTSMPELIVSVQALRKGNAEMALGNIFGSNLFNGSLIVGIMALIEPLPASDMVVTVAVPFLIIATLIYVISTISKKIHSYEGLMYLLIYVLFMAKLLNLF